ncbi:ankyrin-2-like [Helicoverpa armigera]|uniref:ankyrin-2-like n=1 Tax=Helicoverpa armigera TaxID=29058 RepID=UPI0030829B3B
MLGRFRRAAQKVARAPRDVIDEDADAAYDVSHYFCDDVADPWRQNDALERERLSQHAALRELVSRGDCAQLKARLSALGNRAGLIANLTPGGANTLLYVASEAGLTQAVSSLLDAGADGRAHPVTKYCPLYIACYHGHADIARLLLASFPQAVQVSRPQRGAVPSWRLSSYSSWSTKYCPLYIACYHGHADIARLLLASFPQAVQVSRPQRGAVPSWRLSSYSSWSTKYCPLYIACYHGHADIARLLLASFPQAVQVSRPQRGAVPSWRLSSYSSWSTKYCPLYIACYHGHADIARLLLASFPQAVQVSRPQRGAVPSWRLSSYSSWSTKYCPLYIACYHGHADIARLLLASFPQAVQVSRPQRGAVPSWRLSSYSSWSTKYCPLYIACYHGHADIARLLLASFPQAVQVSRPQRGAVPSWRLSSYSSWSTKYCPLYIACYHGHADIARLLLASFPQAVQVSRPQRGAVPSWRLSSYSSWSTKYCPLYIACYHGHADIARLLLASFPQAVQQETVEKWLPLHAACIGGHAAMVTLLLEYPYPDSVLTTYTDATGQWQYSAAFDVNARDVSGQTALYVACTLGNLQRSHAFYNILDATGQWQYSAAFDVNARDVSGQSAVYVACTLDNLQRSHAFYNIL